MKDRKPGSQMYEVGSSIYFLTGGDIVRLYYAHF
jgi:hypothetical protein